MVNMMTMMSIMVMTRRRGGTARPLPKRTAPDDRQAAVAGDERILSTAEARAHLSETLGRVAYAGERVLIGKRGKPMAALVPIADLYALRALEDAIDLEAARKSRREGGASISHADVGKRLGLRSVTASNGARPPSRQSRASSATSRAASSPCRGPGR